MGHESPPSGTVRVLGGAGGGRLARWLDGDEHLLCALRPLVGPRAVIVVGAGPDDGPATSDAEAEAEAVRLRRAGVDLAAEPVRDRVRTRGDLVQLCRRRGRESVVVWRADPSLLTELQLGGWYNANWRGRLVRRAGLTLRVPASWWSPRFAADLAFWSGVRDAADGQEWRRLTASSYVVLCYHRILGQAAPGQERMDVTPRAFRAQLRALRALGWRALSPDELEHFHDDPRATLPRRRFVLTADDGFPEAVAALGCHLQHHPHVFAVTAAVGGLAPWLGDAPVADWNALRELEAAGGHVGSHARQHLRLDQLEDAEVAAQLTGSLADLREHLAMPVATLAYPHGAHDARVHAAARRAGYAFAFTTQQGRNGAGTDRWCLRRVEPKIWDSWLSFGWKVLTGVSPPARWERRLESRWRAGRR